MNSLIQCARNGVSTDDTEIYVTHFPCYNCAKALVQAGVKKINYYFDYNDSPLAIKLFKDCGVPYEQIKIDRQYVEQLAISWKMLKTKLALFTALFGIFLTMTGFASPNIKDNSNLLERETSKLILAKMTVIFKPVNNHKSLSKR